MDINEFIEAALLENVGTGGLFHIGQHTYRHQGQSDIENKR